MTLIETIERSDINIPVIAFLIVAVGSFILSFVNLKEQAIEAGITPLLSSIWPVIIDVTLISGSVTILQSNVRNEPAYVGWGVLLLFTAISAFFNVIHSPPDVISRAAHLIPPLSLCVSAELLTRNIKKHLEQQQDTPIVAVQHQQSTEQNLISRTRASATENMERIRDHFTKNPGVSITGAALDLGLSVSTVRRHLKNMSAVTMVQQEDAS